MEGDAIYREVREQGREGPHHVRFSIDDLDASVAAAGKVGLHPVFGKRFSPTVAFVYLEATDGMLFEVLEIRACYRPGSEKASNASPGSDQP